MVYYGMYTSGLLREHVATMARVVALALATQWSLAQCGGDRPSASLERRRPRRVGHAMHTRMDSRELSDSNGVEGREWLARCRPELSQPRTAIAVCASVIPDSMQTQGG